MVLGIYFIENNNIQKSMELVAANMKNADEWLDFTRKNFMSRERAEHVIHMQDGARYIWDSRALRGSGRENYGRIVLIRKV